MKNIKKKSRNIINMCLMIVLIFTSVSIGQAAVSADRTIDNSTLTVGNSTNVTVNIQNDVTQALSLQEIIPPGWSLTRMTDDADQFKASTNEWVWLTVTNNTIKTVTYKLTVPSGTVPGVYNIKGNITAKNTTTSVTGDNAITVVNNTVVPPIVPPAQGFTFSVNPPALTVNTSANAIYSLMISNTGNATDTYNLVANKPNNATVTLDKNNVTVTAGNSSAITLTVMSAVTGTYTVNVTATSKANTSNSATVKTMTTVANNTVVPPVAVLSIMNLIATPSSAISNNNPAKISASVTNGSSAIEFVDFGIADNNNMIGAGSDTVLVISRDNSGKTGMYNSENWPGNYATIGNMAVTAIIHTGDSGNVRVRGMFKASNTSNGTEAIMLFNRTTGNLSNITDATGIPLSVQNGSSTFQARILKFINGNETGNLSTAFTLYSMTGNASVNNPKISMKMVPNGNYKVYAFVKDLSNNTANQVQAISTIPASTTSGSSGGGGGSGDGTYPTFTTTPKPNMTTTAPVATATMPRPTVTVVEQTVPAETSASETPIAAPTKGAPGFEIVAAIGVLGTIYILRRMK